MTALPVPAQRLRRLIRGRAPRPYLGLPGWNAGLIVLIVIVGLWASLSSPAFLNLTQLLSSGQSVVVTALLALGLAPVVITGEIDISLTSNLALAAVLAGLAAQSGLPGFAVVLVALLAGVAGGLLNGVFVALSGMPSLAVTLGTMGAYQGAAYLIGGDNGYSSYPSAVAQIGTYYISQVPVSLIIFIVMAVIFAAILSVTTLGRSMYVIGRSAEVVRRNGSSVAGAKLLAFGLGGLTAGLAALVFVGYYGSGSGSSASGTILLVVTAVALGGLDIYGGSGRISSVVLAAVLIDVLQDGMGLLNVNTTLQTIVIGLLLILSLSAARLLTANLGRRERLLHALRVRRTSASPGA